MEPEIIALARRMYEAFLEGEYRPSAANEVAWLGTRTGWVRAALVDGMAADIAAIARGIRPEPLDLAETLTQRSDRDHA